MDYIRPQLEPLYPGYDDSIRQHISTKEVFDNFYHLDYYEVRDKNKRNIKKDLEK